MEMRRRRRRRRRGLQMDMNMDSNMDSQIWHFLAGDESEVELVHSSGIRRIGWILWFIMADHRATFWTLDDA